MKFGSRKPTAWAAVLAISLQLTINTVGQVQHPDVGQGEDHLRHGVALMKSGRTEDAVAEFRIAAQLNPRSAEASAWLGIGENQLGNFQKAVPAFLSALKIDPTLQTAHYNLAFSYAGLGERQKAIRELESVVKAQPGMASAQYNLAVLLEQEGKFAEAVRHLEAARQQRPDDPDISLHLIADAIKAGQEQQAVETAQDFFHGSKNPQLAARLGAILVSIGRFQEALPMLEYAQTSGGPSPGLVDLLARAYIGAHESAKAIQLLEPVANADATGELLYLLGLVYSGSNQGPGAIQAFTAAAERRPKDAAVHFSLGALLVQSGDESKYPDGLNELARAIELNPREANYYAALGRWLLEHNRIQAAASVLQQGVDNAPTSADLYLLLSVAEAVMESTQIAQPTIGKAISLNPHIPLAYDVLGFCYFRVGDYSQAAESYKKASDLSPQTGRFAYDAALAFERGNRANEAVPYAERATEDDPKQAINHYMLGKLYSKMERKDDSVRELETAVRLNPSLDYAYYLLARMYMRTGNMAKAQELNQKLQEIKKQQMTTHGINAMTSEPAAEATPSMLLGSGQAEPEAAGSTVHQR